MPLAVGAAGGALPCLAPCPPSHLHPTHFRPEERIRAYFKNGGVTNAPPEAAPAGPSQEELAARFPPPDAATFNRWFPGLPLSRTACEKPR
jgi:hypothetical protein